ncbi:hypothetical protein PG994_003950 [Apiospora phragmitis]|uniref:Uncharacterized protein n=1 Tax=Apiospora phragmitis TaxID=2905665 RepID=A0ABR1VZP3_9PEZI
MYALYGMAPPKVQQLHPPDYHKHPRQIFQETAATSIEGQDYTTDGLVTIYRKLHAHFSGRGSDKHHNLDLDPYDPLLKQVLFWTSELAGQKLVVTERGYIGLCPPRTMNGDLGALLPSLMRPVILREWKGDSSSSSSSSAIVERPRLGPHKVAGFACFPELVEGNGLSNNVVDDILAQESLRLFLR